MSPTTRSRARPRRRPAIAALLAALAAPCVLALLHMLAPRGQASAAPAAAQVYAQTDDSLPARHVTLIGSSPQEGPGETWGVGELGPINSDDFGIVHFSAGQGWSLAPSPQDSEGRRLRGFRPAPSALTGAVAPTGAAVLIGAAEIEDEQGEPVTQKVLLLHQPNSPASPFKQVPPVPTSGEHPLMKASGETLFTASRAPLVAALDEQGHAGALVVPVLTGASGAETGVLHWDGSSWTREPIQLPAGAGEESGLRVLAIGASSPQNAWLLVQLSPASDRLALYRRSLSAPGGPEWVPVAAEAGQTPGEPLTVDGSPFTVFGAGEPPVERAQILTVTEDGVWVDGERTDAATPTTLYFKPEGETQHGQILASWCNVPEGFTRCTEQLPDTLPSGSSRSFAWAAPGTPYGERVITGLDEGVVLSLQGGVFQRIPTLGGSEAPNDVGGTLGAAFTSADEGWLGNETLPVHLTPTPLASRLSPWPVPFRHALTAIAPQPGAPVGALTSQALAVGDDGEVTHYMPEEGWIPESLLGAGGRIETPRLRALAWPAPGRAYAVGEQGAMWLWRAETGLWEPDPAKPPNFVGNLLGVAFDPNNGSRGYAVGQPHLFGQEGVILRYGKTWTQETLPPQVAGASFTSIAFAGSEAIVAYRLLHRESQGEGAHYSGGLLVNEGSGWHVDQAAAQALGTDVPWAVAGLPDGGAAISATPGGLLGSPEILERDSPSSSWQTAPPYPGSEAPGSLALFRENGALRAIGSGGLPETLPIDDKRPTPLTSPAEVIPAYPVRTGYVVRQTAVGWSDEEHERNPAQDPLGEYKSYDMVYQPDPTSAVLTDAAGASGWAIGGYVNEKRASLDTADVARYPADGSTPPGLGTAPIPSDPGQPTVAIGGGAPCLAPCADRRNAGVGPDLWLTSALGQASHITGMRAFFYTGARVTSGQGHGLFPVPYSREFARYAELLASAAKPAYAAATPTDRGPGDLCAFTAALSPPSPEACAGYFAIDTTGSGGPLKVLVLDTSAEIGANQLSWLESQLGEAKGRGEPALALGNAEPAGLPFEAQRILVQDGASAYFYDAPGRNVLEPMRVGGASIPAYGSGTLGYTPATQAERQDFIGHNGFLLVHVNPASSASERVRVQLIPSVGELAMEAKDGVLLRRSQPALFSGLARRPRAGGYSLRGEDRNESSLYVPIPANCIGGECAKGIFPEYTFTSSRPDFGQFVVKNTAVADPHAVLLNAKGEPVPDEPRNSKGELNPEGRFAENANGEPINERGEAVPREASALFCAYNKGITKVQLIAGGIVAGMNVTVQAGSVRRPCGTQPLKEPPGDRQQEPPPPPSEPEATPSSSSSPPLVPLPPAPVTPPLVHTAHAPPPFFVPTALGSPPLAFVPPPVPTPARPTPPSGTSAVTSPVEVAEHEEDSEEATESVSNQAVAYRASEHDPAPAYIIGIVVLAALAGAGARRPRRSRREQRLAHAAIHTERRQKA